MLYVWFFALFATASCCRFLFRLILNRKLFGIFEFSLAPLRKRPIFLLFVFSIFLLFWINYRKWKQKRKNRFLGCFCPKTYVFVANKALIFSDLRLYRANHTQPPTFGTSRVGQLSSENFLFFYFLFFVKYYDFANSAFLPNFDNFWEYNIYFSFWIKFHSIYFCLFLCVR